LHANTSRSSHMCGSFRERINAASPPEAGIADRRVAADGGRCLDDDPELSAAAGIALSGGLAIVPRAAGAKRI
jgi:hypothetical protein